MDFSKFEETAGIVFKDKALLKQAFTHRSYLNENKTSNLQDNERLEYFGDAVLGFVIADYLFKKFPEMDEEGLTALRAALVNWETCADVAEKLGIKKYLLLSKGAGKDGETSLRARLADALEALIGAIYTDQGYEAAREFVLTHIASLADDIVINEKWMKSPKSLFQEKTQESGSGTPTYKVIKESGPDHDKKFTVGVYIGNQLIGQGEGQSKQGAEQGAAIDALKNKGWE